VIWWQVDFDTVDANRAYPPTLLLFFDAIENYRWSLVGKEPLCQISKLGPAAVTDQQIA
jgi:hypothetical protein